MENRMKLSKRIYIVSWMTRGGGGPIQNVYRVEMDSTEAVALETALELLEDVDSPSVDREDTCVPATYKAFVKKHLKNTRL
jgi:hypothetical protein